MNSEPKDEQQRLAATYPSSLGGDLQMQRAYAVIAESEGRALNPEQVKDYAHALATVGRYKEADALTGDYGDVVQAIENGTEMCNCPPIKTAEMVDGKPKEIDMSQTYIVRDFPQLSVKRCNSCGHLCVEYH